MPDEECLTRTEVEKIVDKKLDQLKQERLRNQRMIKSLQEEVDKLRNQIEGGGESIKGQRKKLGLEYKVMKAVAKEINRSRKNVADPARVIQRVADQGELKSYARIKIDELVENEELIRQSSGDLVFMDPEMTDIDVLEGRYQTELMGNLPNQA